METMDSKALFIVCMQQKLYMRRDWLLHAFSLTRKSPMWDQPYFLHKEDGKWFVKLPEQEGYTEVTGEQTDSGLIYYKRTKIVIEAGLLPGINERVETTLGRVLWHCIVKVYPFNDKIPFSNKKESISDVERYIATRLTDNPTDLNAQVDPTKIYVFEYLKFTEAAGLFLASLTQIFTPGTTARSLVTDPKVYEVRDKMVADAAARGRLHDPAEIAKIKAALAPIDKAWIKGDPSEDYLINKKSFDTVRMKTLLMHGEEYGFGDGTQVQLIPTSIDEGLDLKNFPTYVNSTREGSFNRGYLTMLGGEAFAFLSRIFQNTEITEEDCGRTIGRQTPIPTAFASDYIGNFAIVNKKVVEITEENLGQFAGKTVILRSSQYCGTRPPNYCATCMGRQNAKFPKTLGGSVADVGSQMMYMFMKKAHSTALKTYRYDPFTAFS